MEDNHKIYDDMLNKISFLLKHEKLYTPDATENVLDSRDIRILRIFERIFLSTMKTRLKSQAK
jgi:hypothetical protein